MAQAKVETLKEDEFLQCTVTVCIQCLVSLLHRQIYGVTNGCKRKETKT
jgi:hypothetical protein